MIGYRKLALTVLCFTTSVILLALGTITADNFVSLNQVVIPAFLGTNVAEHFMERRGYRDERQGSSTED
jgi:purine-cytosine permease-like protein